MSELPERPELHVVMDDLFIRLEDPVYRRTFIMHWIMDNARQEIMPKILDRYQARILSLWTYGAGVIVIFLAWGFNNITDMPFWYGAIGGFIIALVGGLVENKLVHAYLRRKAPVNP